MLIVISPAKTLDFAQPPIDSRHTSLPDFIPRSEQLVEILRDYRPDQLASLMGLSDKLASLNFERYQGWRTNFDESNARASIYAFRGDVYAGLDADSLSQADLDWAQQHLRILSGLYGLLRPLDLMQPYRLEMGTRLPNTAGDTLYDFWGAELAEAVNRQLDHLGQESLVNLASNEYWKVLDNPVLKARVVSPVFKDFKGGTYKVISFYAKKARGLMARWIIRKRLEDIAQLKKFAVDGYRFSAGDSTPEHPVFLRRQD